MFSFEVRNGYESNRLLIEFEMIPIGKFMPFWENIVLDLEAELVSTDDVWLNDEYIRRHSAPIGRFFLTVSNGDLPFIMADGFEQEHDDNFVILAIAEALAKNDQFSKLSTSEK